MTESQWLVGHDPRQMWEFLCHNATRRSHVVGRAAALLIAAQADIIITQIHKDKWASKDKAAARETAVAAAALLLAEDVSSRDLLRSVIRARSAQFGGPRESAWGIPVCIDVDRLLDNALDTFFQCADRPSKRRLADTFRGIVGPGLFRFVVCTDAEARGKIPSPAEYTAAQASPLRPHYVFYRKLWLTPDVLSIAEACYKDKSHQDLPVLADALEDAGCDCTELLAHLRGMRRCGKCLGAGAYQLQRSRRQANWRQGPHGGGGSDSPVRGLSLHAHPSEAVKSCPVWVPDTGGHFHGCWALDLILGKRFVHTV